MSFHQLTPLWDALFPSRFIESLPILLPCPFNYAQFKVTYLSSFNLGLRFLFFFSCNITEELDCAFARLRHRPNPSRTHSCCVKSDTYEFPNFRERVYDLSKGARKLLFPHIFLFSSFSFLFFGFEFQHQLTLI